MLGCQLRVWVEAQTNGQVSEDGVRAGLSIWAVVAFCCNNQNWTLSCDTGVWAYAWNHTSQHREGLPPLLRCHGWLPSLTGLRMVLKIVRWLSLNLSYWMSSDVYITRGLLINLCPLKLMVSRTWFMIIVADGSMFVSYGHSGIVGRCQSDQFATSCYSYGYRSSQYCWLLSPTMNAHKCPTDLQSLTIINHY